MNSMKIRIPKREEAASMNVFFRTVITDTFAKEGLNDHAEDLENEIESKRLRLERCFESEGGEVHFLVAEVDGALVGSIEHGPPSSLILEVTDGGYGHLPEIGTVFVHPAYQRRGIGNSLLEGAFASLRERGIDEFCLDSGYRSAQRIWTKKFGEPDFRLRDYWGKSEDHMIWKRKVPSP